MDILGFTLVYIYIYDCLHLFLLFQTTLFGAFLETFLKPSGCFRDAAFELPDYGLDYGPDYGATYYGLRTGLRTGITGLLTALLTETNLTLGPPRQESMSFLKRSNTKTVCF